MKLFITLSAEEEFNFKAWVQKGVDDPAFKDHPWKVVLQEQSRARYDEIAGQFTGPVPGPVPTDPVEAFKARQRVSNNAAWVCATQTEINALVAKYPNSSPSVHEYVNAYTVGGSGAIAVNELFFDNKYQFVNRLGVWQDDVNQAADAEVKWYADGQQKPVLPPFNAN